MLSKVAYRTNIDVSLFLFSLSHTKIFVVSKINSDLYQDVPYLSRLRDVTSELPENGAWCMLTGHFLAVLWDILKKMGHLRGSDVSLIISYEHCIL